MLIATVGAVALAGPLPPIAFISMGYRELSLGDLKDSSHFVDRKADKNGYLSVSADFNGDGVTDEARILVNAERGDARVVVVIKSPSKVDTYVLEAMPIRDAEDVGIKLGPAPSGGQGKASLILFRFGGHAKVNRFDGDEFIASSLP